MAGAFATYLAMKGVKKASVSMDERRLMIGARVPHARLARHPAGHRPPVARHGEPQPVARKLFGLPLIFSAALLSFAHGANDVANAVGPLAAIVHAAEAGEVAPKVRSRSG
jgi:PiT family inorganic phosphate transporter